MKSDLSKVKLGDSIWVKADVTDIESNSKYPIRTNRGSFTLEGKYETCDKHPSAFLTNPFEGYKVDEDFIKEAYSDACPKWQTKLKEKFPEVFKNDLEVGKWYRSKNNPLAFCTKVLNENEFIGYGFGTHSADVWFNESERIPWNGEWTLATEAEVEEALINEAKKRGFKEGVGVQWKFNGVPYSNSFPINTDFYFESKNNSLTFNGGVVFRNGTWAEIIPTVTELSYQQIADKFGVDVNTLKIKK